MTLPLPNPLQSVAAVEYPDTDGEPMAENTIQYDWIVKLKSNLDHLLPAFVAGDLFWYPVEGDPTVRVAPDVLVAEGRPKGPRSSYMEWLEGRPPSVVFEVWSPGNSFAEQVRKLRFYDRHGVEEFIGIRPETGDVSVFVRTGGTLEPVASEGWVSRLGIRFEGRGEGLRVIGPDGKPFRSEAEMAAAAARADAEASRADAEASRADAEAAKATRLAERLRALGIDPDGG